MLARAGAAAMQGARRRASANVSLDLFTGGTFTRSTEGSYLTGAPTSGSSAFLAWAATNVRRIENRGDNLGDALLIEGSRTNLYVRNESLEHAAWYGSGAVTTGQPAPDGSTSADRVVSATAEYRAQDVTLTAARYAASWWVRAFSGTPTSAWLFATTLGSPPSIAEAVVLSTTYQRRSLSAVATAVGWTLSASEGRGLTSIGGPAAAPRDGIWTLGQVELGPFPSSAIRTTTAAATRGADVLTYASGQYPSELLTRGLRVSFAPDFSSTEQTTTADVIGMASPDPDGGIALVSGGFVFVREVGVGWASRAATWSRGQQLTIEVRPGISYTLSGFTTGNGTVPFGGGAWNAGTLHVGGRAGGVAPFFGRISRFVEAL